MDHGAIAHWDLPQLNAGTITTDSGSLIDVPCSYEARLAPTHASFTTTPDELLAAAIASCFTMTFAAELGAAGHAPTSLRTEARLALARRGDGLTLDALRIHCAVNVPGISAVALQEIAQRARAASPIAQLLRVETTVTVSAEAAPGQMRVA